MHRASFRLRRPGAAPGVFARLMVRPAPRTPVYPFLHYWRRW